MLPCRPYLLQSSYAFFIKTMENTSAHIIKSWHNRESVENFKTERQHGLLSIGQEEQDKIMKHRDYWYFQS